MDNSSNSHRTLSEFIFQQLREAILEGQLAPGEHLVQDDIAQKLDVSRIPVREALHRLQSEGLVTIVPHKGAGVAKFTTEDLEEIYMLRGLLEAQAVRLATRRATPETLAELRGVVEHCQVLLGGVQDRQADRALRQCNREFHLGIARASGARRLQAMIEKLWDGFPRYGTTTVPAQRMTSCREHGAIYQAMAQGDEEKAASLLAHHIDSVGRKFIEYYRQLHGSAGAPWGPLGIR